MKYEKEFRQSHPETVGEKDNAFDMSNYIDWLDGEFASNKLHHDSLVDCGNKILDSLENNEAPKSGIAGLRILLGREN